jgi:hypothetical protein
VAFNSLLEGVLRDCEDMAVMIAYSSIRRHFSRLGYLLDTVHTPRLVVLDAADDSNVLVLPSPNRGSSVRQDDSKCQSHSDKSDYEATERAWPTASGVPSDSNDKAFQAGDTEGGGKGGEGALRHNLFGFSVVGLRDWGNSVFGDPLMAKVFSEGPTAELLRGFDGTDRENGRRLIGHGVDDAVRDGCASVRLLFYEVYHLTACIVKEFYRPKSEGRIRELAARKKLNEVLAKLEEIEDDPKRGLRWPTGEMSAAKKQKTDQDGLIRD